MISTAEMIRATNEQQQRSRCNDEASQTAFANSQGAASCQGDALTAANEILTAESTSIQNKDNDALGDGNKDACDVIFWDVAPGTNTTKAAVTLAIILFFAGLLITFVAYYSYNRYVAHRDKGRKFKDGEDWKYKKNIEMM